MSGPDLSGPGSGPRLPDLRQIVGQAMTASRVAEGQTVFGGYGSSGLTPAIQRIAAQLPYGGLAPGSEANTLKPADRFAAKLARLAARNPGQSPEELASSIGDAVRSAFTFEPADYTEGHLAGTPRAQSTGLRAGGAPEPVGEPGIQGHLHAVARSRP